MVEIITEPISVDAVLDSVRGPDAGGIVLFLGTVRASTAGRGVERLTYEAYRAMALSEMERLIGEAKERFSASRCAIVHRTGVLEIGEVSIVVAAAAAHRAEAFAAARFLIDALKERVPIWKREEFSDGEMVWARGA